MEKEKERNRSGERERRDFIAGINGKNITRFRFRQLFTLRDCFSSRKSFVFLLPLFKIVFSLFYFLFFFTSVMLVKVLSILVALRGILTGKYNKQTFFDFITKVISVFFFFVRMIFFFFRFRFCLFFCFFLGRVFFKRFLFLKIEEKKKHVALKNIYLYIFLHIYIYFFLYI